MKTLSNVYAEELIAGQRLNQPSDQWRVVESLDPVRLQVAPEERHLYRTLSAKAVHAAVCRDDSSRCLEDKSISEVQSLGTPDRLRDRSCGREDRQQRDQTSRAHVTWSRHCPLNQFPRADARACVVGKDAFLHERNARHATPLKPAYLPDLYYDAFGAMSQRPKSGRKTSACLFEHVRLC